MSNRLNFAKSQALMQIDQANSYTARLQEQKRLEDEFAEKVRELTEEQEEYAGAVSGISTAVGVISSLAAFAFTGSTAAASAAYGAGSAAGEFAATDLGLVSSDDLEAAEALVDDFDFTMTDPEHWVGEWKHTKFRDRALRADVREANCFAADNALLPGM